MFRATRCCSAGRPLPCSRHHTAIGTRKNRRTKRSRRWRKKNKKKTTNITCFSNLAVFWPMLTACSGSWPAWVNLGPMLPKLRKHEAWPDRRSWSNWPHIRQSRPNPNLANIEQTMGPDWTTSGSIGQTLPKVSAARSRAVGICTAGSWGASAHGRGEVGKARRRP